MNGQPGGEGTSARIGRQVVSVWGVQVAQLCLQVGYTALVSRHANAASFGQYAAALAVAATFSLLANAGLSNAAARRSDESVEADRRTLTVGLVTGVGTAALLLVTTPLWTRLWADPSATSAIAVVSLALALGPAGAILLGILRRQGRIGTYNAVQLGATATALLINVPLVLHFGTGWSLALLPGLTNCLVLIAGAAATGRRAIPTRRLKGVGADVSFGIKSMGLWGLAVIGNLAPLVALGRFCGTAVLGEWNRAQVVGRLPFETGARGLLTVLFPRLAGGMRYDPYTRRSWSLLTSGTALIVIPLGSVLLPAAPAAVRILLGPQWTTSAAMVPFVAVGGIGLVLTLVVSNALEASAFFRLAAIADVVWLGVTLIGALGTAATQDWRGVALGVALAPLVCHGVQLTLCARSGLLVMGLVSRSYGIAALLGLFLGGLSWAGVHQVADPVGQVAVSLTLLTCTVLIVGIAWRSNGRLRAAVSMTQDEARRSG